MLSESLGIGRTPVREAVQRLAEYHLVVIMKRHGIRIAEVNEQEQLLVLETRRELERLIATRAARRASAEDKKTMAAMAQALLKAGKAGDVVEMLRQYFVAKTFTAAARATASRAGDRAALHPVAAASTTCTTRS
jgi:DNA-binding GntR family transcriptional regulator